MDREVQAEFDEMREAHRRAMERMDKADARAAENHRRAMERMEKFDQQLQAMRKLVEAGIKIVSQLAADTRELKRSQKAFLDSLRHAGNGRRHA
jgi:uncharacterized protein YbaP (TraB family)